MKFILSVLLLSVFQLSHSQIEVYDPDDYINGDVIDHVKNSIYWPKIIGDLNGNTYVYTKFKDKVSKILKFDSKLHLSKEVQVPNKYKYLDKAGMFNSYEYTIIGDKLIGYYPMKDKKKQVSFYYDIYNSNTLELESEENILFTHQYDCIVGINPSFWPTNIYKVDDGYVIHISVFGQTQLMITDYSLKSWSYVIHVNEKFEIISKANYTDQTGGTDRTIIQLESGEIATTGFAPHNKKLFLNKTVDLEEVQTRQFNVEDYSLNYFNLISARSSEVLLTAFYRDNSNEDKNEYNGIIVGSSEREELNFISFKELEENFGFQSKKYQEKGDLSTKLQSVYDEENDVLINFIYLTGNQDEPKVGIILIDPDSKDYIAREFDFPDGSFMYGGLLENAGRISANFYDISQKETHQLSFTVPDLEDGVWDKKSYEIRKDAYVPISENLKERNAEGKALMAVKAEGTLIQFALIKKK